MSVRLTTAARSCAVGGCRLGSAAAKPVRSRVRCFALHPWPGRCHPCSILATPFGGIAERQRASGTAVAIGIAHGAVRPAFDQPGIARGAACTASVGVRNGLHIDTVHASSLWLRWPAIHRNFNGSIMTSEQWTLRCAEPLLQQWPRVDRTDLEHLASALWTEPRWQSMEPSAAAIAWIAKGIPGSAQGAH